MTIKPPFGQEGMDSGRLSAILCRVQVRALVMFSPLLLSIMGGHAEVADFLLRYGASILVWNIRDEQPCGTTALHYAAVFGAS